MKKSTNYRNLQTAGLSVVWECPKGHEDEDKTPLARNAYCTTCGAVYEWPEVRQVGPLRQLPRVTAAEAHP